VKLSLTTYFIQPNMPQIYHFNTYSKHKLSSPNFFLFVQWILCLNSSESHLAITPSPHVYSGESEDPQASWCRKACIQGSLSHSSGERIYVLEKKGSGVRKRVLLETMQMEKALGTGGMDDDGAWGTGRGKWDDCGAAPNLNKMTCLRTKTTRC
jgi:hypothetical protein